MKINTEIINFPLADNYKSIIEKSSIVKDFDTFIEMANDGLLALSKTGTLTIASTTLVNENITRKISLGTKRPVLKSYHNVVSLFVLFCFSGLRATETKGKKEYLKVNLQMLEQWKQFSDVEKYFTLFSLTFTNFSFEPLNDRDGIFEFEMIMHRLAINKKKWASDKRDEHFFNQYQYKTILITLEMLGLIEIQDTPVLENKACNIQLIKNITLMSKQWELLEELRKQSILSGFETNEDAYCEDEAFTVGDIEGIARGKIFADKITQQVPEFAQRLRIEIENRPGMYYFKVSVGKAWRILKVDYRSSLDNLCQGILDSFDFEIDHLYDVSLITSFGHKVTFNGAPDISFAEYPTTDDILIGDLPININDKMNFTFDYGDNWEFAILLEKIEDISTEANLIPDIKTIQISGKAPDQYKSWD